MIEHIENYSKSLYDAEEKEIGMSKYNHMLINSVDAQKFADFFMKKISWLTKVKVVSKNENARMLGQIHAHKSRGKHEKIPEIRLFSNGSTVATLIHELAHLKEWNHSPAFFLAEKELIEEIEKYSFEEILDDGLGDLEDVIEYILDIWEEGEKITRGLIGRELSEIRKNTTENLSKVISELNELGVAV